LLNVEEKGRGKGRKTAITEEAAKLHARVNYIQLLNKQTIQPKIRGRGRWN